MKSGRVNQGRRQLLKTVTAGVAVGAAGVSFGRPPQHEILAKTARGWGCYPSYDKEWPWPVQLDLDLRTELPPYSTRGYFIEQLSTIQRAYHFQPGTTSFSQWQVGLRQTLTARLGLDKQRRSPLEVRKVSAQEFDYYRLEKLVFQSEPGVWVPAILYLPKNSAICGKALLNCHGHGIGIEDTLYSYVLEFVRRGFIVLAPEVRDFGERAFGRPHEMACDRTYKLAAMLGKDVTGLRLWDFVRAIDYLETRPEVDRNRIACGGLSLGGELAMLLASLDERVRAAFISGFLSTYEGLMFRVDNCICYAIPGILEVCDMPDIAGLIAPRPLVIQSGTKDMAVPTAYTQEAFRHVQSVYRAANAGEKIVLDLFEGGHQFHGEKTFQIFNRWL
jgi:hypothetical protein